MIIFGFRGIAWEISRDYFHCPNCDCRREGVLKQVRNFVTLYFIPLIPLNVSGRHVKCTGCKGTFDEEVLNYVPMEDPRARVKDYESILSQLLRVMVLSALADGIVDESEREEIKRQYGELSRAPLAPNVLSNEIQIAQASGSDLNTYVASFADELSEDAKATLVQLAFHTMSASPRLEIGHQQQLAQLAETLAISEPRFVSLIDQLSGS